MLSFCTSTPYPPLSPYLHFLQCAFDSIDLFNYQHWLFHNKTCWWVAVIVNVCVRVDFIRYGINFDLIWIVNRRSIIKTNDNDEPNGFSHGMNEWILTLGNRLTRVTTYTTTITIAKSNRRIKYIEWIIISVQYIMLVQMTFCSTDTIHSGVVVAAVFDKVIVCASRCGFLSNNYL